MRPTRTKTRSRLLRRTTMLFGGLFILGAACMEGTRVPSKSPNGALGPGAVGAGKRAPAAFRVVFAGPRGEASDVSELSLVFSRPLRKLELAGAPPPALTISPAIAGKWLWVGTHALHFVPDTPHLPGATQFQVTAPATLRSLDGSTLGEAFHFEFTTPRPKLVDSEPSNGSRGLEPSAVFALHFNQGIDPEAFRSLTQLSASRGGNTQPLAFTVVRPDPSEPKRLEVHPTRPLPIDSQIQLRTSAHLTGLEGPLQSAAPIDISVETYGPLSVTSLNCDRETPHGQCAPGGAWSLELSNPVRLKELKRALSINPPVPISFENWTDDSTPISYLSITAPFQAGRTYTLRVSGALRDLHGQALGQTHVQALRIDDYFPEVEIGVTGSLLDPRVASVLPVGSVNVKSFGLTTAALSAEDALGLSRAVTPESRIQLFQSLASAKRRIVTPGGATNHISKQSLDLGSVLGSGKRGPVAIGVDYEKNSNDYRAPESFKIVKFTDLALTAKMSVDGSLVWVTRVSSGESVAGASVRVLGGAVEHDYQTDAQGLAVIPAKDFAPRLDEPGGDADDIIVLQSGDDWTFEDVRDYISPWRLPVPIDLSGKKSTYGLIFTERGIYRPGDEVQVKGIVRRELVSGNATPAGESFTLSLYSPDAEEVQKQSVKLSRFGTFFARLKVPVTGHLGSWQIRAEGPQKDRITESFEVAEYHPSEFKVAVESDHPSYVRGDTARWTSHADYLFGAPMAKAQARVTLSYSPSSYEVPRSEGFVTSAAAYHDDLDEAALSSGLPLSQDVELDANGSQTFARKLDLPTQRGPEIVTAEAEVTDISRQSLSGSTSAIVHPAAFYVGLKAPEDVFVNAPGQVSTSVLTLAPDGQRLAGKSVQVELISRRWTYAREAHSGSASALVSRVVDQVVGTCEVKSALSAVPCTIAVKEAGYHVLRAVAKDARGNTAESAFGVYGIGASGTGFGDSDRLNVALTTNKQSYQIGDTARILIKSPFPEAEALVTVERAGVYRSQRLKLHGPTPTVEVPISEELRPNAFVSVHLVRARDLNGKAALDAPYRIGYAELRIDPEARRLSVAVHSDKSDYLPGSEVSVDVDVKDKSGKPRVTEVTLYAADEGVLSLIGYRTPDPIPVFTAARPLGVATLESRDAFAHVGLEVLDGALGDEKGRAGGGGGSSPARSDFRQTAYFNPSLQTDANGKAHVRFKLPESLTTYRIMAVAVSEGDLYGYGTASVTTSKRLMARPELPRFLRAGDSMNAGVVVSSKNFDPGQVTVLAHITGLTLQGEASRTVALGRNQSVEVRFPLHAEVAGKAQLRFDVSAGVEKDAVSVDRRVDSPATLEAVALYGKTEVSVAEALGDMSSIRPDVGKLDISVSSSALVGLEAGVDQLVEYPYGCTEQLASRLIPLVPLRDLAQAFKIPLPLDADRVIPKTVAEILSRQHADGGFGLWPDSRESYPWVGAYALFVLAQANQHGVAVPKRVFDNGREYLRHYLAETNQEPLRLPTEAFVVDVLADMGTPDFGYMQQVYERREQLPLFAKALLLHALAESKASKALISGLLPELENSLRIENDAAFLGENTGDEYAVLMDSQTRTAAMVLRALLAVNPAHPLAAELARGILRQRAHGTWRSTQETAYALLALDAYRKAQEQTVPDFEVKGLLGEQQVFDADFHGRSTLAQQEEVSIEKVAGLSGASLVFEKHGKGTLFYQARLRYARRVLPTDTLDQGFFVRKALRSVTAEGLPEALQSVAEVSSERFKGGGLVLADLVIVTPSPRDFVVVDDPLPAGFEAVDSRLSTTSTQLDVGESADSSCDDCDDETARDELAAGRTYFENYTRRELRDDRVLFFVDHMAAGMYHYRYLARATTLGKFVLPSTRVEEMYTPETFGRNGATLVDIE